jgi:serine/threonine protein kinase
VHYLIGHPIALKDPCILPFRELETEQLGRRVFLDKQTVYKLYDTDFSEDPSSTLEALKHLPSDYLHNGSLVQLNERVNCLKYDYIPGKVKPSNLRQFAIIMKDLHKLHVKNFVHGDIRKENLLFGHNCEEAWMIDFDLSGLEGTLYPPNYNWYCVRERHKDARASRPMKKSHDLYALSIIIQDFYRDEGRATCMLLRKPIPDLLKIAQKLLD